jgi:protein-L-isoaspartate(D-aspartate) O-methyltransferase
MVERVRRSTGIEDAALLDAFARVPRHEFVPERERQHAYEDRALPLTEDQTISQPSMIAIMLNALGCRPEHRALEIGAGCGYAAALLAVSCREVDAIEIRPKLAAGAAETLARLGFYNARVHVGDGRQGLVGRAPFDRILVSAAASSVPGALLEQLAPGGRIAIPVGGDWGQKLMVGDKQPDGAVRWHDDVPCMFVPLVGG